MKFRSKFEKKVNAQLKRAKCNFAYENERIPYVLARHYIPDFIMETPTGRVYIECKGFLRMEDKAKLCAVKRQHPNKDIRIIFYSKNPKYIKWAEKVGFRYAIERIPKEWMEGL